SYSYEYPSVSAYSYSYPTYVAPDYGSTAASYYTAPSYYVAPEVSTSVPPAPATAVPATGTDSTAHFDIVVPLGAEVSVDGVSMPGDGAHRYYQSPALTPGVEYPYTVKGQWTTADGAPVDREQVVRFHAGESRQVNLSNFAGVQ